MLFTLKYALRQLARSPGFSTVAILMLALGIGLSTAAFSITNVALLRAMPFPEGERLVRVFRTAPESASLSHSPGNFLDLRAASTAFASFSATYPEACNVSENGQPPEQTFGLNATADFFTTFGVQPFLGRGFAPDEDQPGKGNVIILAHGFWVRKFAADSNVIGRTLRVNSADFVVIGVLPPVYDSTPVWGQLNFIRPLTIWPNFPTLRNAKWYDLVARLKPGVELAAAQTELSALAARLANDDPANNGGQGIRALPLASSNIDDNTRKIYWFITGLAVLVLVIACANLASVQLARAFGRSHELAVRAALGAGRLALMRPLLAESLVLAVAGGLGGVLLAYWTNRAITASYPGSNPIPLDGLVILFAVLASLLTGLTFGFAPAWLSSRVSTGDALKETSRGSTGGRVQRRLKSLLLVGQLALAFVLVSAALSFGVAVRNSLRRDFGWKPGQLITGIVGLPFDPYKDGPAQTEFTRALAAKLAQIPGVTGVSIDRWVPIFDYFSPEKLFVEGQTPAALGQEPIAAINGIDAHFLEMLGIPLREGRGFPADVRAESPPIVIVNEATARRFWPGESALGKRLRFAADAPWAEVVGVARDVRMAANFGAPISRFQIYRPLEQAPNNFYTFVVRSTLPIETLERPIRRAVADLHPDIMIQQLGTIDQILRAVSSGNNFMILTLGAFALTGLCIALIGLYGVMMQLTLQRQREIGVRLALGADRRAIVRLILVQGAWLIVGGLIVGGGGTFGVYHLYRLTMPELQLPGAVWQIGLALLLGLVGLGACYLPAHRASRVDPADVLRAE